MLFDPAHTEELKAWLASELEPICDADPLVLSDYVMALLKREVADSELTALLREQLEDFTAEGTGPFVDRVLAALSSKTYLPESMRQPAPTSTTAPPSSSSNPTSSSDPSTKKRRAEDELPDSPTRPSKIPTVDESIRNNPGLNSALPNGPQRFNNQNANGNGQQYQLSEMFGTGEGQLRKGMCVNYHRKGFCSRGDSCIYEHGPNKLLGTNTPSKPANGNGTNGSFASTSNRPTIRMGATSPSPGATFGSQPRNGAPGLGRNGSPSMVGEGELAARMGSRLPRPPRQLPQPPTQQQQHHPQFPFQQPMMDPSMMMGFPQGMQNGMQPQGMMFPQGGPMPGGFENGGAWRGGATGGNHSRGGRGGSRGGGGAGHFGSNSQKSDTTLVLENVPVENLELVQVNEYFKRFGTITNIQIDAPNKKALVSFAKASQATEAHSNPESIFGNRFVKCYFQRLDEASTPFQQPQQQQKSQQHHHQPQPQQQQHQFSSSNPKIPHGAVAPPPKSSFIPGQTSHVYHAPGSSSASSSSTISAEERKKMIEAQKQKQTELNELIQEQKTLMDKVMKSDVTPEDRKSSMSRLRTLGPQVESVTKELKAAMEALSKPSSQGGKPPSMSQEETQKKEIREQKEKERLDRELDWHAQSQAAQTSSGEDLKETLRKLQAEATSIGVGLDSEGNPLPADSSSATRGGRGGSSNRGSARGRGRGGAGGMAWNSMKLDNRTTRLQVKGLKKEEEGKREKAKEHFKQFGDIESFEDDTVADSTEEAPGFVVVYKTRASGESAIRQGTTIPEVGSVKLSWSQASSTPSVTASQETKNERENGSGNEAQE